MASHSGKQRSRTSIAPGSDDGDIRENRVQLADLREEGS